MNIKKTFANLITSIICATSFLTGAVPAVNAETVSPNSEYGDLTYALVDENEDGKNDYVKIVKCNMYVKGNLEIPAEIEGLPVRVIGDEAFITRFYVESITLPESVTVIGKGAFQYCDMLKKVNIPENIKEIGNYAFYDCPELTEIVIPGGVKTLGEDLFGHCTGLVNAVISEGITYTTDHMFANCSSLKTIVLPSTLKTIDVCTFDCCSSLTSVTLPENLETIGEYAFRSCSSIKNIKIPASVSTIDLNSFYNCSSLQKAFIRNPECSIGPAAFTSGSDVNVTVICYKNSSAQEYAEMYKKNIILFGDVKYDGKIDLYDLIKICQNIAGVIDITGDEFEIADIRENGAIDLYDAIAVARMLVSH